MQNHAATEEFLRRQQFSPQRLKQTRFRCDFTPLRNNIALCTLGADERPLTGHDEVTSVDRSLVLSSTAVHLGEHGSIHDLAESEIYRWPTCAATLHCTAPSPSILAKTAA